jgi:hypothetical protein
MRRGQRGRGGVRVATLPMEGARHRQGIDVAKAVAVGWRDREVLRGWYAGGKMARGPVAFGPAQRNSIHVDLFKNFSNRIKSIRSKNGLPLLKKFQIKHGLEGK